MERSASFRKQLLINNWSEVYFNFDSEIYIIKQICFSAFNILINWRSNEKDFESMDLGI